MYTWAPYFFFRETQSIIALCQLMGWFWEGPEDVTKNVFYWTRVAVNIAQGIGMHRSVESSQLSKADKRLWKRVWWTIFTRDRSCAVALGRQIQHLGRRPAGRFDRLSAGKRRGQMHRLGIGQIAGGEGGVIPQLLIDEAVARLQPGPGTQARGRGHVEGG